MSVFDLHILDDLDAWGQPWHGVMDAAGVLTLPNGSTKTTTIIPVGGQAQLVKFDGLPVPVDEPCDIAAGASWKNWAILAGHERQYMPLLDYKMDPQSWLYRTDDGTVYKLRIMTGTLADPVQIVAQSLLPGGGTFVVYTGFDAYKSALMLASHSSTLSASQTGRLAIIQLSNGSISQIQQSSDSWRYAEFVHPPVIAPVYAKIEVSGGTVSVPPTVLVSTLDADFVSVREPCVAYANMICTERYKRLVSAWVKPDGNIARTYIDYTITRTMVTGALFFPWYDMASSTVLAKLITPTAEITLLSGTITQSLSPTSNGPHGSSSGMSIIFSTPDTSSTTDDRWSVRWSADTDESVTVIEVGACGGVYCQVRGGLGGAVNPVSYEDSTKQWCQHPITGELVHSKHFF